MNFANLMNLTNPELGLAIVEGTLLVSFVITLVTVKRMIPRKQERNRVPSGQLKQWVRESEAICQNLAKNLEEKREIAKRLIAQLDEKIQNLQSLAGQLDEKNSPIPEGLKSDLGTQVLALSKAGHEIPEIARRLSLSKGEVELVLNLKRYCQ
jgi:hypothetical protein